MSDKLTRLLLPGQKAFIGVMDWGEQSAEHMIADARRHAAHLRKQAAVIEAASDADFQIDVVRGSIVQHHVCTVQVAMSKSKSLETIDDRAQALDGMI